MSENQATSANLLVSSEDRVEKNWQRFGHVTMYAAYKPENLRRSFKEICSIRLDLWLKWKSHMIFNVKLLYREITIKYVSSENLVNFLFHYVYIKLFLGHIENQYIYLVSTWSLNAWNNRIFCMKSWTINCCIILVNYLVDSH